MSIAMPVDAEPQTWMNDRTQPQPQQAAETSNGRLRDHGLSDVDRHYAVAIHLSPLASFFVTPIAVLAPLVLWLVRKDKSAFNDDHGREAVNFLISFVLLHALLIVSCFFIIGIPVAIIGIPTLWIVGFISVIRGAIAAGKGEFFRYPMTIRLLT